MTCVSRQEGRGVRICSSPRLNGPRVLSPQGPASTGAEVTGAGRGFGHDEVGVARADEVPERAARQAVARESLILQRAEAVEITQRRLAEREGLRPPFVELQHECRSTMPRGCWGDGLWTAGPLDEGRQTAQPPSTM